MLLINLMVITHEKLLYFYKQQNLVDVHFARCDTFVFWGFFFKYFTNCLHIVCAFSFFSGKITFLKGMMEACSFNLDDMLFEVIHSFKNTERFINDIKRNTFKVHIKPSLKLLNQILLIFLNIYLYAEDFLKQQVYWNVHYM